MQQIYKSYLWGFGGSIILAFFTYWVAQLLNQRHVLNQTLIDLIQISSFIFWATTLYGQRYLEIATLGGKSHAEVWDGRLCKFFLSLSIITGIFGCLLKP